MLFVLCIAVATPLVAQQPDTLTLDVALAEARAANATLPLARYDTVLAAARLREARAAFGPRLSIGGDLHAGTPTAYAATDGRLQLIGDQTIYDGTLGPGVALARAGARSAAARYRVAQKDLELEVTTRFAEMLAAGQAAEIREEAVGRLERYLSAVQARQAAGQAVADDVLRTRVRLGQAQADLAAAGQRLDDARIGLNDLLGRAPDAPLVLAPLPAPQPPPALPAPDSQPWEGAPDVRQALADQDAARAALRVTRAARLPQLVLSANVGTEPLFTPGAAAILNTGQGPGAEVTLALEWPLWDLGGQRARVAQANAGLARAGQAVTVARRDVRLEGVRAAAELARLWRQLDALARTEPTARDSYLLAESSYRGGTATALEVLDAYDAWLGASLDYAATLFAYREALARWRRWSTP